MTNAVTLLLDQPSYFNTRMPWQRQIVEQGNILNTEYDKQQGLFVRQYARLLEYLILIHKHDTKYGFILMKSIIA